LPAVLAAALLALAADSQPQAQSKKGSSKKTAVSKSSPATASASKTNVSATKKASAKTVPNRTASKQTVSRYKRSAQVQPTPERYKEIQQALTEKGYFGGAADGNWGPGSVDALKRFQHDQNLPDDGKIGSLSLIALGLGPKHEPAPTPASQGSGIQ
jgi:peptidoglycan hydrolase-like protein with peptidoglycan-binding domain